jgi:hypothetical protein
MPRLAAAIPSRAGGADCRLEEFRGEDRRAGREAARNRKGCACVRPRSASLSQLRPGRLSGPTGCWRVLLAVAPEVPWAAAAIVV